MYTVPLLYYFLWHTLPDAAYHEELDADPQSMSNASRQLEVEVFTVRQQNVR